MKATQIPSTRRSSFVWFALTLLAVGLSRFHSYLLFHSLVEILGIGLLAGVFILAWNTRHIQKHAYLLFVGIAGAFVAAFATVHLLAYKGMNVFPEYQADLATQLWIASRYVLSLSMLAAPLYVGRKLRAGAMFGGYAALAALLFYVIFAGAFPACFIEGFGLTPFKKVSEFVVSAILVASIWALHRERERFDRGVYRLLVGATGVIVISELAFVLYVGVYDIINVIGHLLGLVGYYLIYVALVETGLRQPYALLFRDLQRQNDELEAARDRLEVLWAKSIEAEAALRESESQVRRKLDVILAPEGDLGNLELADIIDTQAVQALMDQFYAITRFGVGIIDLKGRVLVATGWQDICTQFHRACEASGAMCRESDLALSRGVAPGTFKAYKCRNNMWDVVTPIVVGGNHVGNIFLGQFLYEDEVVDRGLFRDQAQAYGFDEAAYLAALERVPRWSRAEVHAVMAFYATFARHLSTLSYANIRLARTLTERDELLGSLQQSLDEKTVLLREVHHRVKNNLTTIIGLMMLQQATLTDAATIERFQDLEGRVRSISMVHELLYQSELLSSLDFEQYLHTLVTRLGDMLDPNGEFAVTVAASDVEMSLDLAVPCGLIINELVTNAFKHAFPPLRHQNGSVQPRIVVTAAGDDELITLSVSDNGVGLPDTPSVPQGGVPDKSGLGLHLVRLLSEQQLRGHLAVQRGEGTTFRVAFPAVRYEH